MKTVRKTIGGLGNLMFKQAYLVGQMLDGVIPDVYVQSEKYWIKYENVIKQMFGDGIGKIDSVALQIRRGDYLSTDFYMDMTQTDYYQKATELFPDDRFLVFCHDNQDPETDRLDKLWVREYLDKIIPGRYEMNTPIGETQDLNTMASCKGIISANSSFGWWAGFLGEGKTVIPKQWFSDGIMRVGLPDKFIKL